MYPDNINQTEEEEKRKFKKKSESSTHRFFNEINENIVTNSVGVVGSSIECTVRAIVIVSHVL